MSNKYDCLKLENQLCFPLYACAKEVVRKYTPILDELDLTYTQYIAMMVLWEEKDITSKRLGEKLYLDSGTLTPLLNKLEKKGYVEKHRDERDQRDLMVHLTTKGLHLRDKALAVPEKMQCCIKLDPEEGAELYRMLHKMIHLMREE